jgi:hypothetical protein
MTKCCGAQIYAKVALESSLTNFVIAPATDLTKARRPRASGNLYCVFLGWIAVLASGLPQLLTDRHSVRGVKIEGSAFVPISQHVRS